MGSEDDAAYRRSVRNVSGLLVVVVIVVLAGLVLPSYLGPGAGALPTSNLAYGVNGLTLSISVNATRAFAPSNVSITVWINGTSSIDNVTTQDSWAVDQSRLWERPCTFGWPIGIGVMHGYYDQYNYTLGTLLPLKQPYTDCPTSPATPQSFLVQPDGSEAIASINGSLDAWNLQTTLVIGKASFAQSLQIGGTFTVIGADEWGDVAILYIVAPLNMS